MLTRVITVLATLLAAPTAMAAADLSSSIAVSPSSAVAYGTARYTVTVSNIGNKSASNCSVRIQLPATHTSPQVYVLGILGAKSASCVQTGTRLDCALGTINRNASKSVFFDIALPVSTEPFVFTANATTTSAENSGANNGSSRTAVETYESTTISGPITHEVRHCTGTGLTAFYECTLFPSSLSSHQHVLEADGSVTIPGEPGYTGSWELTVVPGVGNHLVVEYEEIGFGVAATFEGWAADRAPNVDCFEGLTTFPGGGAYVSPYEICPL